MYFAKLRRKIVNAPQRRNKVRQQDRLSVYRCNGGSLQEQDQTSVRTLETLAPVASLEVEGVMKIDELGFKWIEAGYWQNDLYDVCVVPTGNGHTFTACLSPTPDITFCLIDDNGNRLRFGRSRLAGRAAIYARHKSAH